MIALFFLCGKVRECNDMRFCRENIDKSEYAFKLIEGTIKLENNEFSANLSRNGDNTNYIIKIYKVVNSGFRFRIDFDKKLDSYRYDIAKDPAIMIPENIENHSAAFCQKKENFYIITCENHKIIITTDPFVIKYTVSDVLYMTVNSKSLLTIESGEPQEDESFDGFNETFPHGKSAVGIDISFENKNFRLTGLSEGIEEFNLVDQVIRRYNRGTYSHYGYVPFLQAHCPQMTKSAGIYWSNPTDTFWKLSTSEKSRDVRIISETGYIDFYLFVSDANKMTPMVATITGKAPLPPVFALAYHQSKWGYSSQKMVQNVTDTLHKLGIPHDVMWMDIDQWEGNAPFIIDKKNFPNLTELASNLNDHHRFLVRIADPHLASDKGLDLYDEGRNKSYFVKNQKGKDYVAKCWPGKSSWPDFTREEVREWWGDIYGRKEGWIDNVYPWNDMNEPSVFSVLEGTFPKDALFHGDLEVRQAHSVYGHLMLAASYNGMKKRGLRPFVLTRSFFGGSQRYSWHWNGDNTGNYTHLRLSLDMVMVAGLGGLPYSGSDIGGYYEDVGDVLLARWYQASMLTQPFFREHNRHNNAFREPFLYIDRNPTIYRSIVRTIKDRYRLLGFWYTAAYHNSKTGVPLSLPLWAEWNTEEFADVHDHVLVDGKLLSVPVLDEERFDVKVAKPPGRWFHWRSGKELNESGWFEAPIDDPAAFLRGGTITPFFETPGMSAYETIRSNITLYIALDENGEASGDLYLDDGRTFKYEEGEFVHSEFVYNRTGLYITHEGKYGAPKVVGAFIFGLQKGARPSFNTKGDRVEIDPERGVARIIGLQIDADKDARIGYDADSQSGVNLGVAIGIPIAVVAAIVIGAVGFFVMRNRKKNFSKTPLLTQD